MIIDNTKYGTEQFLYIAKLTILKFYNFSNGALLTDYVIMQKWKDIVLALFRCSWCQMNLDLT